MPTAEVWPLGGSLVALALAGAITVVTGVRRLGETLVVVLYLVTLATVGLS